MGDKSDKEPNKVVSDQKPEEQPNYPFPKYVAFILGNEFCERYSYCGLRAVLVLYCTYFIGFDEDTSTVVYHGFTVLAYLFPLMGAAIADGYWGKFKTIFWLSLVYSFGMITQAIAAIPIGDYEEGEFRTPNAIICILGLVIVACGTGGIKPCVSSFGGDQFESDDVKNTTLFFDMFYWAINAGSVISTFVSPVLRQTTCGALGTDTSCYFLSFAVPALLMMCAIALFLFGNRFYRKVPPSGRNIFYECVRCMWLGLWRKIPADSPVQDHWLYGAYGSVDTWIIRDTTYLVKVLVMFTPLPIFWAAFDQKGSRWTLQALRMNGYLSDSVHILPDQAQLLNAGFILILIPIFNATYRTIDKCFGKGTITKLRRISVGMVFAAITYLVCAQVQKQIDVNLTVSPGIKGEVALSVLNLKNEEISGTFYAEDSEFLINELDGKFTVRPGEKSSTQEGMPTEELLVETVYEEENPNFYGFQLESNENPNFYKIDEGKLVYNLAIFDNDKTISYPGWSSKDSDGKAKIVLISSLKQNITVKFTCNENEITCKSLAKDSEKGPQIDEVGFCEDDNFSAYQKWTLFNRNKYNNILGSEEKDERPPCIKGPPGYSSDITIPKGNYTLEIFDQMNSNTAIVTMKNVQIGTGAAYTLAIIDRDGVNPVITQDINTNDISMLWIIPQFFIITMAEVMISITGLEFAYTQAPVTLKSVLASCWLLTVSFGNFVVIIVAEGRLMPTQVKEYYLFFVLIVVADIIFILLAIFYYEYVEVGEFDDFDYPPEILALMPSNKRKGGEGLENKAEEKEDEL